MNEKRDDSSPGSNPGSASPEHPSGSIATEDESAEAELAAVSDGFAIVGVGASAGGLEAFSEFLRNLAGDTGMAFVLVQHLDPRHESILAPLLAAHTHIPVTQVQGDTKVEPDHVYVIPPNTTMLVSQRVLKLHPRAAGEAHRPIDLFLISLAKDLGSKAIGVILSGSASDGTLGLKAIKGVGGITFCQDLTATFDSMPRSAVAAGVVDFVLPPSRIAAELGVIARHPYYVRRDLFGNDQDRPAMQKILNLLRDKTSVDFSLYKQPTVLRRLARRMALRNTETPEQYLALLPRDIAEMEALFDDLLINVTEFFRDPQVFESLKRVAFPAMIKDRAENETFRVWVPGCSSGEEIYSIAISLVEFLEEQGLNFPVQLFGTDISDRIIEKARQGVYTESVVSALSPERLRRFFARADSGYQISRTIREMCIFSRHNVAKDPPLSRMDLISCRNLLIYLSAPLQKRVIATFGYALQPRGCLLLGSSETVGTLADYFNALEPQHKIFCRKPNLQRTVFDLQSSVMDLARPLTPQWPASRKAGDREPGDTTQKYVDRMLLAQFGPAALIVDPLLKVAEFRGEVSRYLLEPRADVGAELWTLIHPETAPALKDAITEVRRTDNLTRLGPLEMRVGGLFERVLISIIPIQIPVTQGYIAIVYQSAPGEIHAELRPADSGDAGAVAARRKALSLEQELNSTREYLQAIIEELRSSSEEAQSTNEELQSTNEELQTAKEELQSSNEELHTVNAEMQSRNSELAQVNNDLTNLLSSLNMPVVMMGNDLHIRHFTPTAQSVLHLIPSDVGRPISDLQPRIRVPDLERLLRHVIDTLEGYEQEVQDFEGRWYLLRLRPYRTSDNRIDGAVMQLLDVGELKRTLQEVRTARDYAQAIVDTVREPLVVFDQDLRVEDANRAFYSYFAIKREDVVGRVFTDVRQGLFDNPKLVEMIRNVLETHSHVQDLEIDQDMDRVVRRVMMINARRMPAPSNARRRILLAFEDITEQKQAAEARYRRLFETAKDGIVIVDAASGEIADINPYVEQLFGYGRAELIGQPLSDAGPFKTVPQNSTMLESIRQQGVVLFPDLSMHAKDGRTLPLEIVGNIYSEADRRVIQLNLRDLTERRRFEREMQHTAKLESLGLLAGGIAHDFNNLLTGVLGNANLAYTDMQVGDPNRQLLREVMHAAERAAHLTRQMLAYAGKGRYVIERLNLPELVRDILALVQTSIPKTVEVILDLDAATPEVEADPGQLQQLIMNLVINGAEAIGGERTGRVSIWTRGIDLSAAEIAVSYAGDQLAAGRYARIAVVDTGSGMEQDTQSRIFDPFFTTKFTGRGLGLAAALGIIKGHRGSIRVASTLGEGSSFQVLLPAAPVQARSFKTKLPRRHFAGAGTILVIDDEETVRKVAEISLQRAGFRVLLAENGRAGTELFRINKDDVKLIVLDLLMPVMGGEETLDQIREIRPDVPVIVVSGSDEIEVARRFGSRHYSAFMQKPYTFSQLISAVSEVLSLG